jgi:hypothetical protein
VSCLHTGLWLRRVTQTQVRLGSRGPYQGFGPMGYFFAANNQNPRWVTLTQLLSLHAWRKTLRSGIPALHTTTTKSTVAERPRKSRDRGFDCAAFSTICVFNSKCLRGWQYDNSLLACAVASSRTASDALEVPCIYLRLCQAIQRHTKSVSPASYLGILGHSAVVQGYCFPEQDQQLRRATCKSYRKVGNGLAALCQSGY